MATSCHSAPSDGPKTASHSTGPDQKKAIRLTEWQKIQIVRAYARHEKPEPIEGLTDRSLRRWNLDVPANYERAAEQFREEFDRARREWLEKVPTDTPVHFYAYRVRVIQRAIEEAERSGDYGTVLRAISTYQKELALVESNPDFVHVSTIREAEAEARSNAINERFFERMERQAAISSEKHEEAEQAKADLADVVKENESLRGRLHKAENNLAAVRAELRKRIDDLAQEDDTQEDEPSVPSGPARILEYHGGHHA